MATASAPSAFAVRPDVRALRRALSWLGKCLSRSPGGSAEPLRQCLEMRELGFAASAARTALELPYPASTHDLDTRASVKSIAGAPRLNPYCTGVRAKWACAGFRKTALVTRNGRTTHRCWRRVLGLSPDARQPRTLSPRFRIQPPDYVRRATVARTVRRLSVRSVHTPSSSPALHDVSGRGRVAADAWACVDVASTRRSSESGAVATGTSPPSSVNDHSSCENK